MTKSCPQHGDFETRLANDAQYYYEASGAGDACCGGSSCDGAAVDPFDTLSTCIALIDIVDTCNLKCPTCYAASPPGTNEDIRCTPFDEFVQRVEGVLTRKTHIDVLQLSGGEPTLHPEFFRLLDWSLREPRIDYVLVNTNAVRIATDDAFRMRLGRSRQELGGFELYVQFDGPQEQGQAMLRGGDFRELRRKAIDECGALGVPSTLAMVVTPDTLPFIGDSMRFGLERPHCRGITLQPMFQSGRAPVVSNFQPAPTTATPLTTGDVIEAAASQSGGTLTSADFTPLPCGDPNCHTMSYILRTSNGLVPLGQVLRLPALQDFLKDKVNYSLADLARCGCDDSPLGQQLQALELGPHGPFRIFIKPFMDAWTYDQDRIDRCCTHVIRPDGKLDSFCRYYLHGGAHGQTP
jgi:hypothetical protein